MENYSPKIHETFFLGWNRENDREKSCTFASRKIPKEFFYNE